jgi:hypothetical protein
MRSKLIRGMPLLVPTLIATATYGLFMPSPALAEYNCAQAAHEFCNAFWQDYYPSRDDCLYTELGNCAGTAQSATLTGRAPAPALRVE